MHRVLGLLLNYFILQEVASQMYVDHKVTSFLARECNELFKLTAIPFYTSEIHKVTESFPYV
jgi:hypothetical protein